MPSSSCRGGVGPSTMLTAAPVSGPVGRPQPPADLHTWCLPGAPDPVWINTRMEECAQHRAGQRQKMKPLAALEHTMERWSNALWTLLTPPAHRQHHPSELVRTLHRECDDGALILDRERILVPNAFVVELPPQAHHQLTVNSGQLGSHLSNQVRQHAAEHGYTFAGPVAVHLVPIQGDDIARFRVRSSIAPIPDTTMEEPDPHYG